MKTRLFVLPAFILLAAYGPLQAAGAFGSGEVLMATAIHPATVLHLTATPSPAPRDQVFEGAVIPSASMLGFPRPVPSFSPAPDVGKALFDANLALLIGLNVADYFSTIEALKHPGLEETNPLMKPFVNSPAAFAAIKAGTTALSYLSMKSVFKKNKTVAWIMTTASNVVLSYVVVNNMRLVRQARAR